MTPEPPQPTPEQKIRILEGSLRCFTYGLCSLIPVLGPGFAVASGRAWARVRRSYRGRWNPARRYLRWGIGLASVGAVLGTVLVFVAILVLLNELD
jgi:hypothetical protein